MVLLDGLPVRKLKVVVADSTALNKMLTESGWEVMRQLLIRHQGGNLGKYWSLLIFLYTRSEVGRRRTLRIFEKSSIVAETIQLFSAMQCISHLSNTSGLNRKAADRIRAEKIRQGVSTFEKTAINPMKDALLVSGTQFVVFSAEMVGGLNKKKW